MGKEQQLLEGALSRLTGAGLADVVWAPSAAWPELQDKLLGGSWHVVHFIGHGDFDSDRDEGVLALTGPDGRADLVEANRLVDLLRQARPMPRLVVLNSCSGAATGITDLFSGTAAALVRGGVSAVAAMQYEISDPAAAEFARGFYSAIARGRGVDDAVSSGRVAIMGLSGRTLEWVTPVLYLRGLDSRLFILPTQPFSGRQGTPAGDEDAPRAGTPPEFNREVREQLGPVPGSVSGEEPESPTASGVRDLAARYNSLRVTMPSSDQRTQLMAGIVDQLRTLLREVPDFDVTEHLESSDRGLRLAAYAYLMEHAAPQYGSRLASVACTEDKPFGQYMALSALQHQALATTPRLPDVDLTSLSSLAQRLGPGEDRARLANEIVALERSKL